MYCCMTMTLLVKFSVWARPMLVLWQSQRAQLLACFLFLRVSPQ